jgi:hypothetical protein
MGFDADFTSRFFVCKSNDDKIAASVLEGAHLSFWAPFISTRLQPGETSYRKGKTRFNGFSCTPKPLKRLLDVFRPASVQKLRCALLKGALRFFNLIFTDSIFRLRG